MQAREDAGGREELRRRVYLTLILLGLPVLTGTWIVQGPSQPFIAIAYPPYIVSLGAVGVGLWRRRITLPLAERTVMVGTTLVYLASLAVAMWSTPDLGAVRDQMTVSSLPTINLMVMLAYVAFETRTAARLSLGIVLTYLTIVAIRIVPAAYSGELGAEGVDYLTAMMFLIASVGLLHVLAQVKGQAAEARAAAEAMAALANTDVLTDLPNRRQLRAALDEHLGAGTGAPVALVLADLDRFKAVNDTYGHDAGDAVLRLTSTTLRGAVRPDDVLGRWGGEEFLVIAPHTDRTDALELAETCRITMAAQRFDEVGQVTTSLGVAVSRPGESAASLLTRADQALYDAKSSGRNRVCAADPGCDVDAPQQGHRPPTMVT